MLNRQSKTALAAAACVLFIGTAFAQQGSPRVDPASGNPAMQAASEPVRPQNPLEQMSRLNSEITTLRAQLQVAEIKSQIKKKEEEMAPSKPEKPVKNEPARQLPPLPNLNALSTRGGLDAVTSKPAASAPKPRMEPQLIAIEGVGEELFAELQSDWGGFARVGMNDKYHEYQVVEITSQAVRVKNGNGQVMQLAMRTAGVQRLQAAAMPAPAAAGQFGGMPSMGGLPPMPTPSGLPPFPAQTPDSNTMPFSPDGGGPVNGPVLVTPKSRPTGSSGR